MPLFRFHRGGFQESLETTIIVKSKAELACHVMSALLTMVYMPREDELHPDNILGIKINPYPSKDNNFDKRIGWYTHIVTVEYRNLTMHPVGFLSELLE